MSMMLWVCVCERVWVLRLIGKKEKYDHPDANNTNAENLIVENQNLSGTLGTWAFI